AAEEDPGVEGHSIFTTPAHDVGKSGYARDAAVGIEIPELAGWGEVGFAVVVGRIRRELIPRPTGGLEPSHLPRRPVIVLLCIGSVEEAVALFGGFIPEERLRNAAPERERRIRRALAGGGKAGIARCGKCRALG